jgi:hypothetical protein
MLHSELLDDDACELVLHSPSSTAIPDGLSRLADAVTAARVEGTPMELRGEASAVEAFHAVMGATTVSRWRRRAAIGATTVMLGVGAGTGLAAAGVLPAPVQRTAAAALEHVGLTVPTPESGGQHSGPPPAPASSDASSPVGPTEHHEGQTSSPTGGASVGGSADATRGPQADPGPQVGPDSSQTTPASQQDHGPQTTAGPPDVGDSGAGATSSSSNSSEASEPNPQSDTSNTSP